MPTYCTGKEVQYVDKETGELMTSTTEKTYSYRLKNNDEFVMMYYKHILNSMVNIKSANTLKVLITLSSIADYNTGVVLLTPNRRSIICKQLNISSPNLNHYINELKKAGILAGSRGEYIINPKFFWKGDSGERSRMLKDKLFYVKFGFTDKPEGQ